MKLSKLISYSFAPNVGSLDRAFRIGSGLVMAILPWSAFSPPIWGATLLTLFGIAWLLTGVVSRCGMYYTLGLSTLKR